MPEYTATAQANLAWAAWREARLADCESAAGAALATGRTLPAGPRQRRVPMDGALAADRRLPLRRDAPATPCVHGAELLAPALMRLPADIEDALSEALVCWQRDDDATDVALLGGALDTSST